MTEPTSYLIRKGISSLPTQIPTPVRLYIRQFMPGASEKTLTEEYFPEEELDAMRTLIEQSRIRGDTKKVPGRPHIEQTTENTLWANLYDPQSNIPANMGFRVPWERKGDERLPGYPKQGSVQYIDYSTLLPQRGLGFRRKALGRKKEGDPTVPMSRVLGSLGVFPYNLVKDPKTGEYKYIIGGEGQEEKFSWNPDYGKEGFRTGNQYATIKNMLNRIIGGRRGLEHRRKQSTESGALGASAYALSHLETMDTNLLFDLLRMVGSRFGPKEIEGEGIPFRISIPAPRMESE